MDQAISDTVECPFCAEAILPKAKKCKHCGEMLDPTLRKADEALRASKGSPNVYMNAGGGGGGAVGLGVGLRSFNHVGHFIVTLLTMGIWLPFWIIAYVFRDKAVYR